ncbi:MAG: hypothetical protein Q4B71_00490 [Cardiobacteriaceae bacterium]|nr:hypothetical protein [Cardiobacteriaceae bacterium]
MLIKTKPSLWGLCFGALFCQSALANLPLAFAVELAQIQRVATQAGGDAVFLALAITGGLHGTNPSHKYLCAKCIETNEIACHTAHAQTLQNILTVW